MAVGKADRTKLHGSKHSFNLTSLYFFVSLTPIFFGIGIY